MWADSVKVSSRKFSEGTSDARVLEFTAGLGSRPILRPAVPSETSTKFSTKITLQISEQRWNAIFEPEKFNPYRFASTSLRYPRLGNRHSYRDRPDQENTIARLTAMLKIPVYFGDSISTKIVNLPNWETVSSDQFISFLEKLEGEEYSDRMRRFAKAESLIRHDGKVVGRAFLRPSLDNPSSSLAFYELGIFIEQAHTSFSICGFVEARAKNAARDIVDEFDIFSDSAWVEKQIDYMTRISENIGDSIACQESLIKHGKIARKLPIVLLNRKECSLDELVTIVGRRGEIRFTLNEEHRDNEFEPTVLDSVEPFIGKEVDEDTFYFLVQLNDKVTEVGLEQFIEDGLSPLSQILREIRNGIGSKVEIRQTVIQISSYSRRKVLAVEMRRVSELIN